MISMRWFVRLTSLCALTLLASLALCASPGSFAADSPIRDSAGRAISVTGTVTKVFPAGPPASIFLYMLAPDLMAGWTRAPRAREQALLAPEYTGLPTVGRLTGRGGSANLETVLAIAPNLILDYGSLKPTYISLADRVQAQTRVPYALIDGRFAMIPDAIRAVGRLIGRSEALEAKAREAERMIAETKAARDALPAGNRPRVYYGRGADGLQTGTRGSINVELLQYAGAVNVAEDVGGHGNLATVSLEQILAWDPDVILTTDPNFYELIWSNEVWSKLRAVKGGRVYLSPTLPFGWFDRPPSANRLIGLYWLLAVLYPERFAAGLEARTRQFYRTFYHVELGDAELARVLGPGTHPGTGPGTQPGTGQPK